ncbi:hypothetical protein TBR22_A24260 [Luteitalea sp. TBR-22]|uniref:sulfotransferase n=1 Tax=Luteitalea sp. TBR-22 TaxID=2802971 RepID=UPI001AF2449B|nr:sulfotransferase [Luteitalea sp. TBR-22]BCS33199.1 hypothetical protein TBR22_A24260 [Luteitalea sp. TBR-22]
MSRESHAPAESLPERLVRKSRRVAKEARRRLLNLTQGGAPDTRVVFIMGAQRSGTRVPLVALESAPGILTYREGARPYFRNGRLQPDAELDRLFAACQFPVLVIKPLSESHRAQELLARFPTSRVLWIFRRPEDTIRSASIKWDSGGVAVSGLMDGTLPDDDWRRGGVTAEAMAEARALYRPGLSLQHANAILWYLRSRLVLDLGLFDHPRVLVVRYEDLSSAPAAHFPRVFDFVGQPCRESYLAGIHDRSVRRATLDDVPAEVVAACNQLHTAIERRYLAQASSAGRA